MSEPIIRAEASDQALRLGARRRRLSTSPSKRGEVFGLLGPNGAGKTTTILMLLGLTEPTSGRAVVAGFDPLRQPLEVKRRVGYMPDSVGFYDHLSGVANLRYSAALCGIEARRRRRAHRRGAEARAAEAAGGKPVRGYSRGMRQRLAIAEILMKGAASRDPRRADRRSRSARDRRTPRDHSRLQRRGYHDPPVVAHARTRPNDCDRVALFSGGHRRSRDGGDDRPRRAWRQHVIRIGAEA